MPKPHPKRPASLSKPKSKPTAAPLPGMPDAVRDGHRGSAMKGAAKADLQRGLVETLGLVVPNGKPAGRRISGAKVVKVGGIKDQPRTIGQTKKDVAGSASTFQGKQADARAHELQAAGVLPDIVVPHEVLPPASTTDHRNPDAANRQARRARALALRIQCLDYRDIHQTLKDEGFTRTDGKPISLKTVFYDVQESLLYLARIETKMAEEVRNLELQRLDFMQSALWRDIDRGDVYAVAAALRIMAMRRDIMGYGAKATAARDKDGGEVVRPLRELADEDLQAQIVKKAHDLGLPVPAGLLEPQAGPSGDGGGR